MWLFGGLFGGCWSCGEGFLWRGDEGEGMFV